MSLRRHINSDIEIMDIMPLSFKSAQNTLTWHSAAISHINSSHIPHLTSNIFALTSYFLKTQKHSQSDFNKNNDDVFIKYLSGLHVV